MPNTVYKVDGNKTFQTDGLGRVEKVESNLSLTKMIGIHISNVWQVSEASVGTRVGT